MLNGDIEEIILREAQQLTHLVAAIDEAKSLGASGDDLMKLTHLSNALGRKMDLPGTKAQLKPGFKKGKNLSAQSRSLEKLQLVFKWGGEVSSTALAVLGNLTYFSNQFTHAARYQSRDLGESMRQDFSIMSASVLHTLNLVLLNTFGFQIKMSLTTSGQGPDFAHGSDSGSLSYS